MDSSLIEYSLATTEEASHVDGRGVPSVVVVGAHVEPIANSCEGIPHDVGPVTRGLHPLGVAVSNGIVQRLLVPQDVLAPAVVTEVSNLRAAES